MLDVRRSPELQGVILLLKRAHTSVRREMRAEARRELNSLWKPTLSKFARTRVQTRVLVNGARSKVSGDSFSMLAATSRRFLPGGLDPENQWHGAEFGANPKRITVTIKGHQRQQWAGRNFGPRLGAGRVVYPSARKVGPRIVAAWVYGLVRGFAQGNAHLETTR